MTNESDASSSSVSKMVVKMVVFEKGQVLSSCCIEKAKRKAKDKKNKRELN